MYWTTAKFPSMFQDLMTDWNDVANYINTPSSKVETLDNSYVIKIAIPGIDTSEVSVEYDRVKDMLEVSYDGEGNEFVGKFKKSYQIPSTIDYDSIEADFDRGILTLTLPKKKDQSKIKIM
jgi:HSP20 family protein